jgi:hypothetical protein
VDEVELGFVADRAIRDGEVELGKLIWSCSIRLAMVMYDSVRSIGYFLFCSGRSHEVVFYRVPPRPRNLGIDKSVYMG